MSRSLPTFLVLLVMSVCISGQDVTIVIAPTPGNSEIKHFGQIEHRVTQNEAQQFGLGPEAACIKRVARKFGKGLEPENCYLVEPTPWKLYPSYGWKEVTSIFRVRSVTLLHRHYEWVIVRERILENQNTENVTIKLLGVTAKVYNSVLHDVARGSRAALKGDLHVIYNENESYVHKLGNEEEKKYLKKLYVAGAVDIVLPPLTSFASVVKVKKEIAEYDIVYEQVLSGHVAANFNPKFRSHHFHAVDAESLIPGREYKEKIVLHTHFDEVVTENSDATFVEPSTFEQ